METVEWMKENVEWTNENGKRRKEHGEWPNGQMAKEAHGHCDMANAT